MLEETKDEKSVSAANQFQMIENKALAFKDIVFNEVIEKLDSLINDVFGNYVVQKLIEFGSEQMRETICNQILGNMVNLTKNKYGCRVI